MNLPLKLIYGHLVLYYISCYLENILSKVISFNIGQKETDIITRIIKDPLVFPKNVIISEIGYKLLNGLLDKNAKNRLDMNDDLFDHWFNEESSDTPIYKEIVQEIIEKKNNSTLTTKKINNKWNTFKPAKKEEKFTKFK